MIASTVLLLAAQAASLPPAVENEIVVLGRRLATWRGRARLRDGVVRCETTSSSGDARLDALRCDGMRWCMNESDAAMQATDGLSRTERRTRIAAVETRLAACATDYERRSLEHLARERLAQ